MCLIIDIRPEFVSDLLADLDNQRAIGSNIRRWKEGHFGTGGLYSGGRLKMTGAYYTGERIQFNDYMELKPYYYSILALVDPTDGVTLRNLRCGFVYSQSWEGAGTYCSFYTPINSAAFFDFWAYDGNVGARVAVAKAQSEPSPNKAHFDLMQAGDISLIDDKFLKIGKDSDGTLPTADATYRGKMIRVEGGAGVADKLYMCMKSASDTYSWVQVATG